MAWTYDQIIAEMHTHHDYAQTHLYYARRQHGYALTDWGAGDALAALAHLIEAVWENNQASEDIIWGYFWGYGGSTNMIPTALDRDMACPFIDEAPPADVTMDAILSAMITANFDQLQNFVGIEDAYRVSLWNEPFNVDYYAALARGFMR